MKTIFIAHNYNENSFSVISYSLAHYLADLGNRVVFISYRPFFKEKVTISKNKGELIICSWPTEKRPTSLRDVFWFTKLYFQYKPIAVIGHFVGANITIGMSKLLSFDNVKTFAYYHTLREQIKYDTNVPLFKRRLSFLRKKMFYKLFCNTIVCPSQLSQKDFEENYHSKKGLVILNPMKDRFDEKKDTNPDSIEISYLGRLEPSKGVIDLIIAFGEYKRTRKDSKIVLNIAGSGSQHTQIEELSKENPAVNFLGPLCYNKVDAYLNKSHYTIIPSKFDNLPTVGLEAMMNRTPVLISENTGLSSELKDGIECFKFSPTLEGIISLFNKVEDNILNYEIMSVNARKIFLEKFGIENYVKKMKEIIESN